MSPARLFRWSGWSLMFGGLAIALHYLTHPAGESAQFTLYPLWELSHWLGGVASLLILFGVVGIYLRQSEKIGVLGFVAFILTIAGSALDTGGQAIFGAIMQPVIAVLSPDWLDSTSSFYLSALKPTLALINIPLVLGYLLLAISTLRAGVFPRWGSWLVILAVPIGIAALAAVGTSMQGLLEMVVGVVLGAGLMIWGNALRSQSL